MTKTTREENSYPFRKPNAFHPVQYWLHSLTASPSEQTQNSKRIGIITIHMRLQ